MPIQVGDRVPSATFKQLTANGVATIDTATLLKGKKSCSSAYQVRIHRCVQPTICPASLPKPMT
jgi:peroxiredoxin